jgi:RNA polymerase sigma-70 factor (ECF subfamily)
MKGTDAVDRETLAMLVRAHQAELYRYLRYLGARAPEAEDLVQETFIVAFRARNAPAQHTGRAMAAWLRGVARNLFLQHCRRRKREATPLDPALLEQAEGVWAGEFLRDGDGFDYVEALRKCLGKLSDKQREALDLRYEKRTSRADMAGILAMTETGVKSLLRRIRSALADCIRNRLAAEDA